MKELSLAGRWLKEAMNKPAGSVQVARVAGAPVYLHWSFPIGGLLPAAFGAFRIWPTLYLCAGFALLILVHELGHAAAARLLGRRVLLVGVSGAGGHCRIESPNSAKGALLFYAGGLLAQAATFVAAVVYLQLASGPQSLPVKCLIWIFTFWNAILFVVNLIPAKASMGGLATDGLMLWRIARGRWPLSGDAPSTGRRQ